MPMKFWLALWRSVRHTMRVIWRVTRELFHETMGALFGLFAVYGAFAAWRQWRTRATLWLMGAAIAYAFLMMCFAWGSFRRARRVR
jgi:hypothetical protein